MNRDQFISWISGASPDDKIHAAKFALGQVGQLDQTYRDRFVGEVGNDPTASKLLEGLKTTA